MAMRTAEGLVSAEGRFVVSRCVFTGAQHSIRSRADGQNVGRAGRGATLEPMDERRGQLSRRALLAEAGTLGALASLGCRAATRETPRAENPAPDVPQASAAAAHGASAPPTTVAPRTSRDRAASD